jgi:hypothetical protein
MNDDILTYLSKKIREEQRLIEENLAMGKAPDHTTYQHTCGVYRGLLIADKMLHELKERMEHADD